MMNEKFLKTKFSKIISKELNIPNTTRYTLEKLERGFGNTIGTAMRRVLLSSIPGVAVFAVEIKGASHEFSTLKDVKQDTVELILNIKNLLLKIDETSISEGDIFELKLTSNEGIVKAKDIKAPSEITIVNKDLVIANTTKDKALEMTLYAVYSKGFKTFEENRHLIKEKLNEKRGLIAIDSNFSSIESVNVKVEEVNPGESRVFERLVMDVTTKGNIDSDKAVAFAGAILRNIYSSFEELSEVDIDKEFVEETVEVTIDSQLSTSIDQLNLSVRSENALKQAGIKNVEELINRSINDLKSIENLGDKSISEIVETIRELGLAFKSE